MPELLLRGRAWVFQQRRAEMGQWCGFTSIIEGSTLRRRHNLGGRMTTGMTAGNLEEIVRRIVLAYKPEKIYLFGSFARGDATADSDFDLMVVVPDHAPLALRRSRRAYEVLRGSGVAADVLVWPHSDFNARLRLKASLPATILREGRLLYAA